MKNSTKAHIAIITTNLFFAANYSLVKFISPSLVKPFGLNVFRVGISLLLFWMVWLFGNRKDRIQKGHIFRFILCGLTGIAINQMFFLKGLTLTSTIHASLLILTTPLLITLFALWVLKEAFTFTKGFGLLLGISGATLLVAGSGKGTGTENFLWGDLLILINAISYAIYFILVKPLMECYTPLQVIRWVFTFGFFLILPFGWNEALSANFSAFTPSHWGAFVAVIFTGTFLTYLFTSFSIRYLGAGITGAYIYTQPVFAVAIATLLLGESFTLKKIVAAALIFIGVFLTGFKKRSQEGVKIKEKVY